MKASQISLKTLEKKEHCEEQNRQVNETSMEMLKEEFGEKEISRTLDNQYVMPQP